MARNRLHGSSHHIRPERAHARQKLPTSKITHARTQGYLSFSLGFCRSAKRHMDTYFIGIFGYRIRHTARIYLLWRNNVFGYWRTFYIFPAFSKKMKFLTSNSEEFKIIAPLEPGRRRGRQI